MADPSDNMPPTDETGDGPTCNCLVGVTESGEVRFQISLFPDEVIMSAESASLVGMALIETSIRARKVSEARESVSRETLVSEGIAKCQP